ncbi:MAG: hypothetical protein Q8N81_00325 [bacterium]|nr:hypothetical protein [bacterium]
MQIFLSCELFCEAHGTFAHKREHCIGWPTKEENGNSRIIKIPHCARPETTIIIGNLLDNVVKCLIDSFANLPAKLFCVFFSNTTIAYDTGAKCAHFALKITRVTIRPNKNNVLAV